MIFTKLYIDNLFSFKETSLDFTFSKKPRLDTIENEFLEGRPKFRFKKVCILSGTNASGKTSLGRVMCGIQNLLLNRHLYEIGTAIHDKNKSATIRVEFALPKREGSPPSLHDIEIVFTEKEIINLCYGTVNIDHDDTVKKARIKMTKLLEKGDCLRFSAKDSEGVQALPSPFFTRLQPFLFDQTRWLYILSDNTNSQLLGADSFALLKENVLQNVLQSFDPSINSVNESREQSGKITSYRIIFENGDDVIMDVEGNILKEERLSKGTRNSVQVAVMLCRIMKDKESDIKSADGGASSGTGTFFLDEKMAYAQTELEIATLNLLIEQLPRHAQLFYTTHNYSVFDMNLPIHAFIIMRKNSGFTTVSQPELENIPSKKTLSKLIRSNYFDNLPNTDKIDKMLDDDIVLEHKETRSYD